MVQKKIIMATIIIKIIQKMYIKEGKLKGKSKSDKKSHTQEQQLYFSLLIKDL